jgi:hypothetical protein
LLGETLITEPPLPITVGGFDYIVPECILSPESFDVTTDVALPSGISCKVFATPPISPGKNFVKSEFRLISIFHSNPDPSFTILTPYKAKFGTLGEAGQKIFVAMQWASPDTGQVGPRIQGSCIVLATVPLP